MVERMCEQGREKRKPPFFSRCPRGYSRKKERTRPIARKHQKKAVARGGGGNIW